MTNTFNTYAKDYLITFAYYTTTKDGSGIGPTNTITIQDCYTEEQAEQKFWELCGQGYEGVCLFDTEEVYSTDAEVRRMEEHAVIEHLFDTLDFGQTDVAFAQRYSDQE